MWYIEEKGGVPMNLIQDIRLYPEHPDFHGEDFCVMKDILQRLLFLLVKQH